MDSEISNNSSNVFSCFVLFCFCFYFLDWKSKPKPKPILTSALTAVSHPTEPFSVLAGHMVCDVRGVVARDGEGISMAVKPGTWYRGWMFAADCCKVKTFARCNYIIDVVCKTCCCIYIIDVVCKTCCCIYIINVVFKTCCCIYIVCLITYYFNYIT